MLQKVVKSAWQEEIPIDQRRTSYRCAAAILGGRFDDVRSALSHPDFSSAVPSIVNETLHPLRYDASAVAAAKYVEQQRRQQDIEDFVKSTGKDGTSIREDMAWLESIFDKLMTKANKDFLKAWSVDELRVFNWCFALAPQEDRRYWCYKFQYTVTKDLVYATGEAQGCNQLQSIAHSIFGAVAYCTKQIKRAVAQGISTKPDRGRPTAFPRDVESVVFRFVSFLRVENTAVYKSTVIHYAMVLLAGTEASLNFAVRGADGNYVLCPTGGVEWDLEKLSAWYKRRFIGDRKMGGARTGNQVLLDVHRAKWHSFEAMQPYFRTHVQALVDEGICYYNEK